MDKVLKVESSGEGSKAKSIRLLDVPVNGHDIEARVDGFGTIYLKSSLVKK